MGEYDDGYKNIVPLEENQQCPECGTYDSLFCDECECCIGCCECDEFKGLQL